MQLLWRLITLVGDVHNPQDITTTNHTNTATKNSGNPPNSPRSLLTKLTACRFLLSLYVMDMLSFVVGRVMLFEILWFAEEKLSFSALKVSLVMTSLEVVTEFVASSITPWVYMKLEHTNVITTRKLAIVGIKVYMLSNFVGLILYSVIGAIIYISGQQSFSTLVLLMAAQVFQYPFLNQIGDQAVEMGLPHWLQTFDETLLVFPGFPLLCCSNDKYAYNLRVPAHPKTLAVFLNLIRFLLGVCGAAIYLALRSILAVRWGFVIGLCCVNVILLQRILAGSSETTKGIPDESVEQAARVGRMFWTMEGFESSLVWFGVLVFGVPQQAFAATLALVGLKLSSAMSVGVLVVGAIVVFVCLGVWMRKLGKQHQTESSAPNTHPNQTNGSNDKRKSNPVATRPSDTSVATASENPHKNDAAKATNTRGDDATDLPLHTKAMVWFGGLEGVQIWVTLLWSAAVLLAAASLLMVLGPGYLLYVALPLMLPFNSLSQALKSQYEAFLFVFPQSRSTDIQFWRNVLMVMVNGPVLAVNWVTVTVSGSDEEDSVSTGVVIAVTVVALFCTALFYTFVDPHLEERRSISKNVLIFTQPALDHEHALAMASWCGNSTLTIGGKSPQPNNPTINTDKYFDKPQASRLSMESDAGS